MLYPVKTSFRKEGKDIYRQTKAVLTTTRKLEKDEVQEEEK